MLAMLRKLLAATVTKRNKKTKFGKPSALYADGFLFIRKYIEIVVKRLIFSEKGGIIRKKAKEKFSNERSGRKDGIGRNRKTELLG